MGPEGPGISQESGTKNENFMSNFFLRMVCFWVMIFSLLFPSSIETMFCTSFSRNDRIPILICSHLNISASHTLGQLPKSQRVVEGQDFQNGNGIKASEALVDTLQFYWQYYILCKFSHNFWINAIAK